jgi:hypothetical protein
VTVWAFSQQDFWSENENEGGWRILGKIVSLFDARRDVDARSGSKWGKNRTWRKKFRASLVRLEVIYLSGNFH